jgi:hypothetical protein
MLTFTPVEATAFEATMESAITASPRHDTFFIFISFGRGLAIN